MTPDQESIQYLHARVQRLEAIVDQLVIRLGGVPAPPTPAPPARAAVPGLPLDVMDAIQSGNKILAIKLYRGHTGLGLREAKEAIDAFSR